MKYGARRHPVPDPDGSKCMGAGAPPVSYRDGIGYFKTSSRFMRFRIFRISYGIERTKVDPPHLKVVGLLLLRLSG